MPSVLNKGDAGQVKQTSLECDLEQEEEERGEERGGGKHGQVV